MGESWSGLVFDMDGTLFDSTDCVTTAFSEIVAGCGVPAPSADDVVAAYPLGPPRVILSHLLGRPATSNDEDMYLAALGRLSDRVIVYPGILDMMDEVRERNVPVGVFTGASAASARRLLGATGLSQFLGTVVGGDEIAHPKPAPDGILRACGQLGLDPTTTVYVGDAPVDLGAARASGALAAAAGWGHLYDPEQPSDVVLMVPGDLLGVLDGMHHGHSPSTTSSTA